MVLGVLALASFGWIAYIGRHDIYLWAYGIHTFVSATGRFSVESAYLDVCDPPPYVLSR